MSNTDAIHLLSASGTLSYGRRCCISPQTRRAAKITGIIILALVAVAVGALIVHKTVGFPKAGDWIKHTAQEAGDGITNAYHKAIPWLKSGSFSHGQVLLTGTVTYVVGIAAGIGIIKCHQHRIKMQAHKQNMNTWYEPDVDFVIYNTEND